MPIVSVRCEVTLLVLSVEVILRILIRRIDFAQGTVYCLLFPHYHSSYCVVLDVGPVAQGVDYGRVHTGREIVDVASRNVRVGR